MIEKALSAEVSCMRTKTYFSPASFYVIEKALSGEVSCRRTGLIFYQLPVDFQLNVSEVIFQRAV